MRWDRVKQHYPIRLFSKVGHNGIGLQKSICTSECRQEMKKRDLLLWAGGALQLAMYHCAMPVKGEIEGIAELNARIAFNQARAAKQLLLKAMK